MKNESSRYSRYFTYIKPVTRLPIVKTYGSTIFTLFVMTFFIIYAIKPTIETILVLQKQLSDETEILSQVNLKTRNLSLGKQNYDNLNSTVKAKIARAIPDTLELKTITATLEQTASRHEASVSALQIEPLKVAPEIENSPGNIAEINFIFNVEGDYNKLISLLQDLRLSDRLIAVDSLSLSPSSEGNGLIMSVSGKAFYLK